MSLQSSLPHGFSIGSIRAHAPDSSGVYGISNSREWIFIGESDNIQSSLLQHVADPDTQIKSRQPTGFSYELCPAHSRHSRQEFLIAQYSPFCNRVNGSRSARESVHGSRTVRER